MMLKIRMAKLNMQKIWLNWAAVQFFKAVKLFSVDYIWVQIHTNIIAVVKGEDAFSSLQKMGDKSFYL